MSSNESQLQLVLQPSPIGDCIKEFENISSQTLRRLTCPDFHAKGEQYDCLPDNFKDCVFVGHKATDLDSIGSALACADLFGGVAARASDINSETKWALQRWGFQCPPPFLDVSSGRKVVLVDHNQMKQMADGVELENLRGCIDHHAMQDNTIVTSAPIFVLIQPWGSCCTIIADMYAKSHIPLKKEIAGLLLCGILSDTLNLRSPTTRRQDRKYVSALAQAADIADVDILASQLFKAKSEELRSMTASQIVMGDMKAFSFKSDNKSYSVAFGVCEATNIEGLIDRREELQFELRAFKRDSKKDLAFLALVNIDKMFAHLICAGHSEKDVAQRAFGGELNEKTSLHPLGDRVSRKAQFIPPLQDVFAKGWKFPIAPWIQFMKDRTGDHEEKQNECTDHDHDHGRRHSHNDQDDSKTDFGELEHICDEFGCRIVRRASIKLNK